MLDRHLEMNMYDCIMHMWTVLVQMLSNLQGLTFISEFSPINTVVLPVLADIQLFPVEGAADSYVHLSAYLTSIALKGKNY